MNIAQGIPALTATAPKTLDQYAEDIDAAADEAAAQKVLDEAKPVLTPADFETLQQNFNMAWKA